MLDEWRGVYRWSVDAIIFISYSCEISECRIECCAVVDFVSDDIGGVVSVGAFLTAMVNEAIPTSNSTG